MALTNASYKMRFSDKLFLSGVVDPELYTIYKRLIITCHLGDMQAERDGSKDPFKKKEKPKQTVEKESEQ